MDGREVYDRLRQSLTSRADLLRYRLGHKFVDSVGEEAAIAEGTFFFPPAGVPRLCALLQQQIPSRASDIVRHADKLCRHQFDLLGYENLQFGPEIDWHSDIVHGKRALRLPWFKVKYLDFEKVGDSKIIWELNRHQHFITLSKAFWLTGDDRYVTEILAQWTHWQNENPYPIGINWASSLEVALRTLSWIWTFFLLRECSLFTAQWRERWQTALSLNGRHIANFLSTYFSANTHLLGEAEALFFLGTLFPGLRQASKWQSWGWKILLDGASRQVRGDGFYFEHSTYYHVYATDLFMNARILAERNNLSVPREVDSTLEQMLNVLALLGRAGAVPGIGDDDGGRLFDPRRNSRKYLLDPLATGAVLYRRGDFKQVAGTMPEETLWLLGEKGLAELESLPRVEPSPDSTALSSSGYYLMADADLAQQLIIDCGDLGWGNGGHGHADALSVCLMSNGQELLMDPGTFEYVGNSGGRARLRGTGAHNTMVVDSQNQAEATAPFKWKNHFKAKAEQWVVGRHFDLFEGSHDGYCRLPSPVVHRRWVFHRKGRFWFVLDRAEGRNRHQLDIAWHIGATLSPVASKQYVFADQQNVLTLLAVEGHGWDESIRREHWSPVYGQQMPASMINFGADVELPADFATLLMVGAQPRANPGRLVKWNTDGSGATGSFCYTEDGEEHYFIFRYGTGPWTCGPWASDADFLYLAADREKEHYNLVLCNASYADAGGLRIVSCDQRVNYAEVTSSAKKIDLFSSDPSSVLVQQPLQTIWGIEDAIVTEGTGRK